MRSGPRRWAARVAVLPARMLELGLGGTVVGFGIDRIKVRFIVISVKDERKLREIISETYGQIHGVRYWIGDERVSSRWWTKRRKVQYYIVYRASAI